MTDLLEELLEDAELEASLREQLEAVDEGSFALVLAKVDDGLAELDEVAPPDALLAQTMARIDAEEKPQPGLFGTLVLGLGSGLGGLVGGVASLGRALARAAKSPSRTAWIAMSASAACATLVVSTLMVTSGDESVAAVAGLTDLQSNDDIADVQATTPGFAPAQQASQNGSFGTLLPTPEEPVQPDDDEYFGGGLNVPSYGERRRRGIEGDLGGRIDLAQDMDGDALLDRAIGGDDGIVDTPRAVPARDRSLETDDSEQTGDGWAGQGQRGEGDFRQGSQEGRPPVGLASTERSNVGGESVADELSELGYLEDGRFQNREGEPAEPEPEVEGLFESTVVGPSGTEAPSRTQSSTRNAELAANERVVAHFLSERDIVDGLRFQPARGLWANTYVPGDPSWRLLGRRLRGAGSVAGLSESPFELAERVQPLTQRIAAPRSGALTLAAQADRASVEGRSRVLLQVALRGAAVRAGRRPTLRSMVVLDLRQPLDDESQTQVRALLSSLSRARTGADRIGLIVAGPKGGVVLEPGQLRLGQVTVALRQVFRGEHAGQATSLEDALATAVERVGQLGDADSPLGSGLVWLVTPGVSESDARTLEPAAHAGSLAGVTTTTIGLGSAELEPLETVALAGQGRRWQLGDDADALVRGEVQAVSRVVARAVRLNVRLAPGVKLVDVLGSRPLAEVEATRVREAERSLDQQLARRLGILSDREEDDDGVQIVVPAFYADDTHVLLFDLVVDGPGPIADVTAKYKDLLRLSNGEATERVALGRGRAERGPREREVLRNLLAHQLSVALRRAAREVHTDRAAAAATIREARGRILAARRELGALASDRDLTTQLESCRAFEVALSAGAPAPLLADSLRYASRRLLFGDPLEVDP